MLAGRLILMAAAGAALLLAGCASENVEYSYPETAGRTTGGDFYSQEERLFGSDGLNIWGEEGGQGPGGGGSGVAVNSFLWRASLDTIAFLPLVSADPFGGVIITDWYVAPETPDERVKMQVYILDRQLRSDGLRVAVFRERMIDGRWVSQTVGRRTVETIEDSILSRARELRVKSAA